MLAAAWLPIFGLLLLASISSAAQFTCGSSSGVVQIDGTVPGEIISPNFPASYPPDKDCTWKITAPLGHLVRIKLTDMKLASDDFLTISDGETAFPGNLIGRYSNCMDGSLSLFSTGSNMVVQFKSDAANVEQGFKLEFKIVRKSKIVGAGSVSKTCTFSSKVKRPSGYIAHQEFPNSFSSSGQCTWTIDAANSNNEILMSYNMFGLAKKNMGFCGTQNVRQVFPGDSSRGGFLCGCTKPENAKTTSNQAHVRLSSYVTNSGQPGFLAYYKELAPGTCSDAKTCGQLTDERDVGFDRNGNIFYEKKEPTTTPPSPTTTPVPEKEPPKAFQVNCKRDEIEIVLNISAFSDLDHASASLLDSNCKAHHTNKTHVFIRTPLDGCGTTHNYTTDGRYITYHNEVLIQKKTDLKSSVITREHTAAFVLECKYHRSVVMSVTHYTPFRAKVYTRTASFGNFTYMMKMYKTDQYKESFDDYPALVVASQKIFFQVEVVAKDAELVLLVENCKVTPSKDQDDKEFYVIIEKGCERDETLEYKHKLSQTQRFNFKAFYFESDKDATIHVHCKVRVCRKADKNSRCVKGCPYSKRRRRSDDVDSDDITGTLMIGPIENGKQVSQRGKLTGNVASPEGRTMFVEILIGVLGFAVMALLVAVMIVITKQRRRHVNKATVALMIEDNE